MFYVLRPEDPVNPPATTPLAYEEAYRRLEETVAELSAGGLSLDEALRRFEQGMALANYCSTLLDQAELRVQQVGQLAPAELDALISGEAPAGAAGSASTTNTASKGATPNAELKTPIAANPLAGPYPQSATRNPQSGGRGLPPTTGPARRPSADEPLDPLFDDL